MSDLTDGQWRRAWTTDNDDGTRTYELSNGMALEPGDTFWDTDRQLCITVTDVATRLAEGHGGVCDLEDHVHFVSDWPADEPRIDRKGHMEAPFFAAQIDDGSLVPHRNNDRTPN